MLLLHNCYHTIDIVLKLALVINISWRSIHKIEIDFICFDSCIKWYENTPVYLAILSEWSLKLFPIFSMVNDMRLSVPCWNWWLTSVKAKVLLCPGHVSNHSDPQLTILLKLEQYQALKLSQMLATKLFLELGNCSKNQALVPLPLV